MWNVNSGRSSSCSLQYSQRRPARDRTSARVDRFVRVVRGGPAEGGFGLENGDEFAAHRVGLVFGSLFGAQFAVIALPSQCREMGLRLAVDQLACGFVVERRTHRFKDAVEESAIGCPIHVEV